MRFRLGCWRSLNDSDGWDGIAGRGSGEESRKSLGCLRCKTNLGSLTTHCCCKIWEGGFLLFVHS